MALKLGSVRRVLGSLALVAVAGLAVEGCKHEVVSPAVGLTSIKENLVCNANRNVADVSIVASGSGFTPMPTGVLVKPKLMLPQVDLQKTQSLTGQAEAGMLFSYSGDPAKPNAANLSWQSEEQMTFRVTDGTKSTDKVLLDPGLYDVTLTNPDKTHKSSLPQGLAVIPPPKLVSASQPTPPAECIVQTQRTFVFSGENFLDVQGATPTVTFTNGAVTKDFSGAAVVSSDCTPIGSSGNYGPGDAKLCKTLTVSVPMDGSLKAGTYDIKVTSPAPADCYSIETNVQVVIVDPPSITQVSPAAYCAAVGAQTVTISGKSFAKVGDAVPTMSFSTGSGTPISFPVTAGGCKPPDRLDASFGMELCDTLTFTIPAGGLADGTYTLSVTNPDPVGCASTEQVTFTVGAPVVTSVIPVEVCSTGAILTIDGSGFATDAAVTLVCPQSGTFTATEVAVNPTGTEIKATFGPNAADGEVCDVVVSNPGGCEDATPHKTVKGTDGPILFYSAPPVVYADMDTQIKLYVTTILPAFKVYIVPTGNARPTGQIELAATQDTANPKRLIAIVPKGTGAGVYDIYVEDQTSSTDAAGNPHCIALLTGGLKVVATPTLNLSKVVPPFGETTKSTAVTIFAADANIFQPTPSVFLNPQVGTNAVQLTGVTYTAGSSVTTPDTLTAVVPANIAAGVYDLVIVNPDGTVGVKTGAYTALATPPPVIDTVVPQSVVNANGVTFTVTGTGFSGALVTMDCVWPDGTKHTPTVTNAAESCDATTGVCTTLATITDGATSLMPGNICVVTVTNGTNGPYDQFSAIGTTGSALNLDPNARHTGAPLNLGRAALAASAVRATRAARFVYAIAGDGDDGTTIAPRASVEVSSIDIYGTMQPWQFTAQSLTAPRAALASATIGRYIYLMGGTSDRAAALLTSERALVLSPEEVPLNLDVDLCLYKAGRNCFDKAGIGQGLPAGSYSYRVAAVIKTGDAQNPPGEYLASDPLILNLPVVNATPPATGVRDIAVKLLWTAPVDALGQPLTGIDHYRVYRTADGGVAGKDEVFLGVTPDAATTSFIDDGQTALGTDKPVPIGSTSNWESLPNLNTARAALAGAAGPDPGNADGANPNKAGTWYVYSLLGKDSGAHDIATGAPLTSYEYLKVSVAANGRQAVDPAGWTQPATTLTGRFQHGAWVVDSQVSTKVTAPTTYIAVGGGRSGGTNVDVQASTQAAPITAGGALGTITTALSNAPSRTGFGYTAAFDRIFTFGGAEQPLGFVGSAGVASENPLLFNNYNAEGTLALSEYRFTCATTIQSAFVFVIAGDDGTAGTALSKTTDLIVW